MKESSRKSIRERDLSRNPLFQVCSIWLTPQSVFLKLAGCQTVKLSTSAPEAKFDIVLHAPEVDGSIELAIVYNADLFSEHRIVNMLDQFTHLLSQVADHPREEIDQYSLVTPSAALLFPTQPNLSTIPGKERFTSYSPSRLSGCRIVPAVVDPDNRWTYSELDRRTNQLANYLIAQGIKPKDVVAIYAHRSARSCCRFAWYSQGGRGLCNSWIRPIRPRD